MVVIQTSTSSALNGQKRILLSLTTTLKGNEKKHDLFSSDESKYKVKCVHT